MMADAIESCNLKISTSDSSWIKIANQAGMNENIIYPPMKFPFMRGRLSGTSPMPEIYEIDWDTPNARETASTPLVSHFSHFHINFSFRKRQVMYARVQILFLVHWLILFFVSRQKTSINTFFITVNISTYKQCFGSYFDNLQQNVDQLLKHVISSIHEDLLSFKLGHYCFTKCHSKGRAMVLTFSKNNLTW